MKGFFVAILSLLFSISATAQEVIVDLSDAGLNSRSSYVNSLVNMNGITFFSPMTELTGGDFGEAMAPMQVLH